MRGSSAVEKQLRDKYQGRTLLIRNFYEGNHLRYDSGGMPTGSTTPGSWTADGFVQVNNIRVSAKGLTLRGSRLLAGASDMEGFYFIEDDKSPTFEINVRLDSGDITLEQANAALSRVFLTAADHIEELVPDYWKPCFRGTRHACHFSPKLLAVPGVSPPAATSDGSASEASAAGVDPSIVKIQPGKSAIPPKVINQYNPQFSEAARRAKVQGTVVLGLVVDASGNPTKIRILGPLGCGLDEQAVRTVESWRFRPAEKDGKPVAAEIAIKIDFHLY